MDRNNENRPEEAITNSTDKPAGSEPESTGRVEKDQGIQLSEEDEHLIDVYKKIASWGKFSAIMMIIFGAISALGGIFMFIVGALPGVLEIFLGIFLLKSSEAASRADQDPIERADVLEYFGKYLKLTGILMIIGIALIILVIVLVTIGCVSYYQQMNNGFF